MLECSQVTLGILTLTNSLVAYTDLTVTRWSIHNEASPNQFICTKLLVDLFLKQSRDRERMGGRKKIKKQKAIRFYG